MWKRLLATSLAVMTTLTLMSVKTSDAQTRDFNELAKESLARIDGTLDVQGLRAPVEVLRDEWGVPHIYARNQHDLFFAQGYVQAQDRLWQMDMWRRINEGRLSEILGPEALRHDRLARMIQYRGDWDAEFARYHPDGREIFEAFAAGVNAWIREAGDNLPVEYRLTGVRPLPWTAESSTGRVATALPIGDGRRDLVLAREIAQRGLAAVNAESGDGVMNWIDLTVPDGVDYSIISQEAIDALGGFTAGFPTPAVLPEYRSWPGAVASLDLGAQTSQPGSNNWVVSGSLTESGEVLLANDPHRGVANPSLRYIVHLNAPGYSVVGATEPAIPGVAIGHNGKVGWGLTIVGTDQADVFIERLNPDNPNQVRSADGWYDLEIVADTIPVLGRAPEVVTYRYGRHGPVFHVDEANGVAYAIRATSSDPGGGGYLGGLRIAEVENCNEFVDVMAYWQAPDENMICGDTEGNIAWVAAALTPRRVGENWYGRLPVPGDTGEFGWNGFRGPRELPHEINPDRGWIATANHDIQPEGYFPPIMFTGSESSRFDRLRQMFASAAFPLSVEDFERMQHDMVHPWWAEIDRPFFLGWTSDDPAVEWARVQLENWDGRYHRISPAAALHYHWRRAVDDRAFDESLPGTERSRLAVDALAEAVATMRRTQGDDRADWRWGRINTVRFPHTFVSAYDIPSAERSGDGGTVFDVGATYREIIDFSDFDNSRTTSVPGQSMQPGSPFYDNLLTLWVDQEYFPLLFTRPAIEANTTHRLMLQPEE